MIGSLGPAFVYFALIATGCNIPWSIAVYELYGTLSVANGSSIYVSIIDFAPNYAGTVYLKNHQYNDNSSHALLKHVKHLSTVYI